MNDKCEVNGSLVTPCKMLEKSIDVVGFSKKKGIKWWQFVNIKTSKRTSDVIGMSKTDEFKDGVAFNFCPFCGTQILNE